MLTPEQRTLRARAAAHALHAQGGTNTGPATIAQLARFERQVDPDSTLPPEVRARRADHARRSYMAVLSLKSSRARSRRENQKAVSAIGTPETATGVQRASAERSAS